MEELEVTWLRSIKVWWSITWRVVIYSLALGFIVSMPLGLAAAALELDVSLARWLTQTAGMLCGFFIAVWVIKIVLGKHYSDFRIILVPSDEALLRQKATSDSPDK